MSDPRRIVEGEDDFAKSLLASAEVDAPDASSRRTAAAALGIGIVPTPSPAPTTVSAGLVGKVGVVALLGVGVLAGVLYEPGAPERPAPPTIVLEEVVESDLVTSDLEVERPVVPPAPEVVPEAPAAAPAKVRVARTKAPVESSGLDAEIRLIDTARAAYARGRHARALKHLNTYERRFASGMLAEEAAALRVLALDGAGRSDAARTAARAFVERYPKSSHGARIEALLE